MPRPIPRFDRGKSPGAVVSTLLDSPALSTSDILDRSRSENFPVAMRWLPGELRDDLMAIYAYARLVDQVGDEAEGDRMAMLEELSEELACIMASEPRHPILRRLKPVIQRRGLGIDVLERLIEANRHDQNLHAVATWDELIESCRFSANPVGELVLQFFGMAREETIALSDSICTALQVVEHCQDVSEDYLRGRIYLPAEDLARFSCPRPDLARAPASPELRKVIRVQVERCRTLLASADALLAAARGISVPVIAGYAAGGVAVCDALERADFDVVSTAVRPYKRDLLWRWLGLMWRTRART